MKAIAQSDVIVTTPEKWDSVSRSWQERRFVQDVALIVIDEIHLLGEDRGPVLEVGGLVAMRVPCYRVVPGDRLENQFHIGTHESPSANRGLVNGAGECSRSRRLAAHRHEFHGPVQFPAVGETGAAASAHPGILWETLLSADGDDE